MVKVEIASKTYRQSSVSVLNNIQLGIKSGEFCCIVGPSGCGKTTLLNLISGLDQDFEGSVTIEGETPLAGPTPGYMFQTSRLMPWLTVRENIELVQLEHDNGSTVIDLLREIELEEFADVYPNQLSGGMRRRVALARAIITEPSLLLLDEPFLSLDAPVANRLRRLLIEVCERRSSTVLFVTHDLREALFLADRVLFVSSSPGRVVLEHVVNIPRPRTPEGESIEMLRLDLLRKHPQLLSGLVESDNKTDEAIL
jgi:ABC-type nitrate/sulfonate/bicarbonate transport system ATPase subunit